MEQTQLLGEYLKQLRENKGISLEYISRQTKINFNVLKNLEEDRLEELPNIAYLKGFVQHYVRIVEGNLDEAFEKLEFSYGQKINLAQSKKAMNTAPLTEDVNPDVINKKSIIEIIEENRKAIITFSIAVGIGFSLFGVYKYINKNVASEIIDPSQKEEILSDSGFSNVKTKEENKPTDKKENQTEQVKDTAEEKRPTLIVKEKSENLLDSSKLQTLRQAKLKEMEKEAQKQKELAAQRELDAKKAQELKAKDLKAKEQAAIEAAKAKEDKALEEAKEKEDKKETSQSKFPYVEFRKIRSSKIYNVLADSPDNQDPDALPAEYKEKVVEGKENVFVNALFGETWLSYSVDDSPVRAVLLKQGKKLFLQGDVVTVFMGNINVTKVFYNNQIIDPMSKTGVKSLIFPHDKIKDFYLPLFKANKDGVLYKAKSYMEKMDEKPEASSESQDS